MRENVELICGSCGKSHPAEMFYTYREVMVEEDRTIQRRSSPHCPACRASVLIESNKMPPDLAHPHRLEDGTYDYTYAYVEQQVELARDFARIQRVPVLQQRARAEAYARRARQIMEDPTARRVYKKVVPDIEKSFGFQEWLVANGVCVECEQVKPSHDFMARAKRGRSNRYLVKARCETCRRKYSVISTDHMGEE